MPLVAIKTSFPIPARRPLKVVNLVKGEDGRSVNIFFVNIVNDDGAWRATERDVSVGRCGKAVGPVRNWEILTALSASAHSVACLIGQVNNEVRLYILPTIDPRRQVPVSDAAQRLCPALLSRRQLPV